MHRVTKSMTQHTVDSLIALEDMKCLESTGVVRLRKRSILKTLLRPNKEEQRHHGLASQSC